MTSRGFITARQRLGWSRNRLATAIGTDEKQIRRWEASPDLIPPALEAWLNTAIAWLKANPPPNVRQRPRQASRGAARP